MHKSASPNPKRYPNTVSYQQVRCPSTSTQHGHCVNDTRRIGSPTWIGLQLFKENHCSDLLTVSGFNSTLLLLRDESSPRSSCTQLLPACKQSLCCPQRPPSAGAAHNLLSVVRCKDQKTWMNVGLCCRQDRTNRGQDIINTREYRDRDNTKTLCNIKTVSYTVSYAETDQLSIFLPCFPINACGISKLL